MDAFILLINFTLLFVVGIVITLVANRFQVPRSIFLVLAGLFFGTLQYGTREYFSFPNELLYLFIVWILVIIIFDEACKFKIKEFNTSSEHSLKLSLIQLFGSMVIVTIAAKVLFGFSSLLISVFLSFMVLEHSSTILMSLIKSAKIRHISMHEATYSSLFIIIFSFLILELLLRNDIYGYFMMLFLSFGIGVLIALIVFKYMRTHFSEKISPLLLLATLFLCYVTADNIGGNGPIAVLVLSIIYGNTMIKEKEYLSELVSFLTNIFTIFLFILLGLVIRLPTDIVFYLKAFMIFIIFMIIRSIAIFLSVKGLDNKEIIMMTLRSPKGKVSCAILLAILIYMREVQTPFPEFIIATQVTCVLLFYSVIVSTIVAHTSK